MKLLVQGDDYCFTKSVMYGINDGMENGILRNTGFFTNTPYAEEGAKLAKLHPDRCYGIDFNLVSGKALSTHEEAPHLVDENGYYIRSNVHMQNPLFATEEGRRQQFPIEEVRSELNKQYDRYVELMGHKPGYLHGHSLTTETYLEVIREISEREGIIYSMDLIETDKYGGFYWIRANDPRFDSSKSKKFNAEYQLNKNLAEIVLAQKEEILKHEYCFLVCHPGYVDAELLASTSLSVERCQDLAGYESEELKNFIKENNIELITYNDLEFRK